ncbi:MAG: YceI family protein [Flavobacteriales bacterium]|nr:YceI family protein [Flavobacteriales bacterium]
MKMLSPQTLWVGVVAVLLSACGGEPGQQETTTETEPAPAAQPVCHYSYDGATTKAFWTAYKHTARVEVKGTFDSLTVMQDKSVEYPQEVLNGATFSIYTSSVNSSDADRDKKIVEKFFGTMAGGDVLTGTVNGVEGGLDSGRVNISLNMNGTSQDFGGTYTIKGEELSLRAHIEFDHWNAQDAVAALQAACSERHTGTDGVSKFWPEGEILVKTTLVKTCD